MSTNVVKRNGSVESLNLEKIHKMVEMACDGVAGVSESAIEMNANLQIFDGIKTDDIQEILIKSANDLISLDTPNYQFVAARLLLFSLRKAVYNAHPDSHPHLYSHIKDCIDHGLYDPALLDSYSEEEWDARNDEAFAGSLAEFAAKSYTPAKQRRYAKKLAALEPHRGSGQLLEIGSNVGGFLAAATAAVALAVFAVVNFSLVMIHWRQRDEPCPSPFHIHSAIPLFGGAASLVFLGIELWTRMVLT